MYPSGGWPYNKIFGMAPYAHDFSFEDGYMFGQFTDEISKEMAALPPVVDQIRCAQLFDLIPKVWCTPKYVELAKNGVAGIANTLRAVKESKGALTGL